MKKIYVLIVLLFLMSFAYAHSKEETPHTVENGHTVEEISQLEQAQELATNYRSNRTASIWPWTYFSEGNWLGGIFAIIIWIALIIAIGTLLLFVIAPHLG